MADTKFGRYASCSSVNMSLPVQGLTNLECKNLQDYLQSRTPETLEKLYTHPPICLAVYRELPEIARQFIIRILFVDQPVPKAVVSSWGAQRCAKDQTEAASCLTNLNVWRVTAIPGGLAAWELSPTFKKSLRQALLGGGKPWTMTNTVEKDSKPRDISFLDSYAMSRWRCVLHYMVGTGARSSGTTDAEAISPDAVRILLHANLMKRDDRDGITITRQGFQFLLLDTRAQVWHFMLQYLDTCEERGIPLPECLSMLFQLSFSTLGRDYSSEGMSCQMLTFLQHLREFGLVFQRKRKEGRFYPTRLAVNVTNKEEGQVVRTTLTEDVHLQNSGYIVVETNYRIYAYTDSPLQVAVLGLFTELLYRFPNLVVGVLTRDSVRQALRGGITAEQIVSYLEQYAHPNMKLMESAIRSKSCLPPTVVDQIKLWEMERNRFIYTEGVVYNQFLSQNDYLTLRDYALSINVLVWQNERTRTMVVQKNGHDDVKRYWKKYSKIAG
ncbi:general transcription factor IIH subunit 4 [Scaptodrosophila lebanonensis]|uniref:General transcription factor IIH subunit 4 n=1 Tax=Drosophila lebanonensis TaxID=7225 RepID=A0A6J2TWT6_DROLE|nr:general transcription factor IIH subunit 4 [Scaptodrosophila lebanonensis]